MRRLYAILSVGSSANLPVEFALKRAAGVYSNPEAKAKHDLWKKEYLG
jgi:hypothetical protein